jgi:hypothetical protein
MMIRSSVLKITGLFEEDYFMYNDEIDIAYRIKKAGLKLYVCAMQLSDTSMILAVRIRRVIILCIIM